MIENNFSILMSFIFYLLFMLGVGWVYYNRTNTLSDYILGDRKLNSWVAAMSAQASDMSGWLLLGLPGYAYIAGMESIWIAVGLAVGTYFNWKFIARRLRKYTEIAGNSITLPDYFENRFNDTSRLLRIISALFILIFFLIYTSSGFVAGAKLFSTVFNLSYITALSIGVLVIISYTFLGGFLAVSWTDFFQGTIMIIAIVIVPLAGVYNTGGITNLIESIRSTNPELLNAFTTTDGKTISAIAIISLLAWGLGYFGQPHILARFMAIKSSDQVTKARRIAMSWVVISLACAVIVGIVGIASLETPLAKGTHETVFMVMVNSFIPPVLAGVFLAAILAAIMSTADSQLLVTSSALTEDFYHVLFRKNASDKELVWISRFAVIAVSLVAYFFAMNPDSSVLGLVSYAWGGFGATFGPVIILSLFWKRMTRNGALGGIICGGVTVLIWKHLSGGIFDLYEIVPGFVISVAAIIIISMIDEQPAKSITDTFDSVESSNI